MIRVILCRVFTKGSILRLVGFAMEDEKVARFYRIYDGRRRCAKTCDYPTIDAAFRELRYQYERRVVNELTNGL